MASLVSCVDVENVGTIITCQFCKGICSE
jgi:hypothetical protein